MMKLYPIINVHRNEKPDQNIVVSYLKLNADFLQIRMKNAEDNEILLVALSIIEERDRLGSSTKIIVNDNAEVAFRAKADGVHVGQEDIDPNIIKEKYPELIVGLSTHDLSQVLSANTKNVDYIGFGPVFETVTKETGCKTVFEHVYEAAERSVHPVVFIGGINAGNIDMLPKGEKIYAASISALQELTGVVNAQ